MDINLTNIKTGISVVRDTASSLPMEAGVYKMLDEYGKILYIGKAKVLASRVASYANIDKLPNRLKRMVSLLRNIEYITTKTEAEALLLEANFIQSIKPPYNINLKDDKSFPYIIFEDAHEYPRVAKYRGKKKTGVTYFGPFASAGNVTQTITELQKLFLIRPCTDSFFASRERPCLQYQIKRCSAPCVKKISREEYKESVNHAKSFLAGKNSEVFDKLQQDMESASTNMEYEKAARVRDKIRLLSQIQAKNMLTHHNIVDGDIIALSSDDQGNACIQVFIIRGGKNFGNRPFFYEDVREQELIETFISQLYQKQVPPQKIICNVKIEAINVIEQALTVLAGYKVKLEHVSKGPVYDFINFAESNAKEALERHKRDNLRNIASMHMLTKVFGLKEIPRRIEVYDNSHIHGSDAVGCMVVARAEGFAKNEYRTFNIKNIIIGDDYAMLREVLTRRLSKLCTSHSSKVGRRKECSVLNIHKQRTNEPNLEVQEVYEGNYPDMILIDGGVGHLSVASSVLQSFGISDIVLVAISKGRDRNAGREFFHMVGKDSFQLPTGDPILHYLQVLRDEAHSYAIRTHRKRRMKRVSISELDAVPNIGKVRKNALLTHFGSVEKIKEASVADLVRIAGLSKKNAKAVLECIKYT